LSLNIKGVDFIASLIILDSKGIDVILGMDWLSKHKVDIDMLSHPKILISECEPFFPQET
jgi:hypothetical protein